MSRSLLACWILIVSLAAGSAAAQGTTTAPPNGKAMPSMEQMDSHMQKMRSLHEKMQNAKTSDERRKLMDEHRQSMREGMAMMEPMMVSKGHGMTGGGGPGMMGGANQGVMGGGAGSHAKPAPGEPSMELMHKRIDMMQMMMQMMMDQQGMGSQATPRAK